MIIAKKLAVYMDHANAHLIEYTGAPAESKDIVSKFTHEEKEHSIGESEKLMHNTEQHEQSDYYKKIGEKIRNYDDVLLFGPTEAKSELYNILKADHHFEKIRIIVKPADKLNDQEQHAFIKKYFQDTDIVS
jgi:stalled ribosome rescue protein Dom34